MLLPLELKDKFIEFTNVKIEFHTIHKKFRIYNVWVDELDENFFHTIIDEFIEGLKTILISNNNNLLIIDELLTILQHKISWFNNNRIKNFSSFSKFKNIIENIDYQIDYDVVEFCDIDKILNYDFKDDAKAEDIIYCLYAHKDRTKQYKNSIDFEKVKLFYFLNQFYKSLLYFDEKINTIKNAIQVYGVKDLSLYFTDNKTPENKCNINLDKISSTFLFKVLIEAKLIYMDDNDTKSESKIKKFAETYFNYTDSKLGAKPLTDFTKEYSKLKNVQRRNKQLDVLNKISLYIRNKTTELNK